MAEKSADAFRTISEVAEWLGTPTHVLRFWESKFSQVKPVKRAGGRRYYRPGDMKLLGGIKKLLHDDGMTIKGVQKLLRENGIRYVAAMSQPLDDDLERFVDPMTPGKDANLMADAGEAPKAPEHPDMPDMGPISGEVLPFSARGAHDDPGSGSKGAAETPTLRGKNPVAEPPTADGPVPPRPGHPASIAAPKGPSDASMAAVKSGGSMPMPPPRQTGMDTSEAPSEGTRNASSETGQGSAQDRAGTGTHPDEATAGSASGTLPGFLSNRGDIAGGNDPSDPLPRKSASTADEPRRDAEATDDGTRKEGTQAPVQASVQTPVQTSAPPSVTSSPDGDTSEGDDPSSAQPRTPSSPGGRRLSLSVTPPPDPPVQDDGPPKPGLLSLLAQNDGPTPPREALAPLAARLAAVRDKMAHAGNR